MYLNILAIFHDDKVRYLSRNVNLLHIKYMTFNASFPESDRWCWWYFKFFLSDVGLKWNNRLIKINAHVYLGIYKFQTLSCPNILSQFSILDSLTDQLPSNSTTHRIIWKYVNPSSSHLYVFLSKQVWITQFCRKSQCAVVLQFLFKGTKWPSVMMLLSTKRAAAWGEEWWIWKWWWWIKNVETW